MALSRIAHLWRFLALAALLACPAAAQVRVSAGGAHVCAIARGSGGANAAYCWGSNRYGQLGLGDRNARGDAPGEMGDALPAVALPGVPVEVATGAFHSCARLSGGAVACWGSNERGQLGLGDTRMRGVAPGELGMALPTVMLGGASVAAVVAGGAHTCALDAAGAVRCWGDNAYGQLGLGDRNARGDAPGEMGTALPAVDLPGAAQAIAAGTDHTCALLTTGAVACWGRGTDGRLGAGDTRSRGATPGDMGAMLPLVALGGPAVEIAAGATHTCARLASGGVTCWGDNVYGQLGIGDRDARGDGPGEMGTMLPLVALPGPALSIATGDRTTCAVLTSGEVRCWGLNAFGQLGLGDTRMRGSAPGDLATLAPTPLVGAAAVVTLGATHACARLVSGAVQCWGSGDAGRLGLGDTRSRGAAPGQMGTALPVVEIGALVLPVELAAFTAQSDGGRIVLRWTTRSETNNAGFAIDLRGPLAPVGTGGDGAWREAAFAPGRGTTTETTAYTRTLDTRGDGRYEVRLRQTDLDGAATYSAVLTVEIRTTGLGRPAPYRLTTLSPNPFRRAATFALTLDVPQHVRIAAVDALGRTVAVLHDGPVDAAAPLTLTLDGAALAPGTYVIRVDGERFATHLPVVRGR